MANRSKHKRRSIRLREYDYSEVGAYFITICVRDKKFLFGVIEDGKMMVNDAGSMVIHAWNDLSARFPFLQMDESVVMPNHIHGIVGIMGGIGCRGEPCVRPMSSIVANQRNKTNPSEPSNLGEHKVRPYSLESSRSSPRGTANDSVGRIIQAFKSITTVRYAHGVKEHGWEWFSGRLWQRNYYEHVIRNEDEMSLIREYIVGNPMQWEVDRENPAADIAEAEEPWKVREFSSSEP
ncbi:MAG: transposase [Candidatus Abyssobacteria bacterium SURF_17]|uniref:Transposase n=1 Tax=Candidatus Abyssobacteria bacterium SURF_17 TaxID=2093361 RepID=A0A419EP21_9BACT|nr:MAG: transposase [Candidatus Abyssubacteria bacterium SURF_17]